MIFMTIEEMIIEEIRLALAAQYHCDVTTEKTTTYAVNREVEGVSFNLKGYPYSPLANISKIRNCYLDCIESGLDDDAAFKVVVEGMMEEMKENCALVGTRDEVYSLGDITDFEWIEEHVYPRICSLELNKEFLSDKVYFTFADNLACYFVVASDEKDGPVMYAPLMKEFFSYSSPEPSIERLREAALKNIRAHREVHFEDVKNTFWGEMIFGVSPAEHIKIYMLSNGPSYGASVIVDDACMRGICDRLGEDYYIVPFSLHEVIVQPLSSMPSVELAVDTVRDMNSLFPIENTLANHIYRYFSETGRVCCVV